MHTFAQRLLIARCWLGSLIRSVWTAESYPIVTRKQIGVPAEATWCARVLKWPGPVGLGSTGQGARTALVNNLAEIALRRASDGKPMPRPGTGLPIEFASAERVNADPSLLNDFIEKALGFKPGDPVFISDESSLADFGGDQEVALIRRRIEQHYAIAIEQPEPVLIADVLQRIRGKHVA